MTLKSIGRYWIATQEKKIKGEVKFFIKEYHHLRNDEFFKASLSAWSELANWINENRSSTSTTVTTAKPLVPVLPVVNLG